MAYPYDNTTNNNYSSSASFPPPSEPDEISLFLQQFLFSTTTPSHNVPTEHQQQPVMVVPYPGRISVPDTSSGLNSSSGGWFPANLSSSSVWTLENDPYEYDCESEEGIEGLVEETAAKSAQRRNSSKRSRAAEVHNLSEKRRRSRINEKMKALQNLIPNSNKTDKASMLDEAIEYLKQLQLQVQMLTMRNGLSLYPVCLPGMVQPNQISQMTLDMFEKNKYVNMSTTKPIHTTNQDVSADDLIALQENHANPVPDFPTRTKASFDGESSIRSHFVPFQVCRSIHREHALPGQQLNGECSRTNLLAVGKSISSVAFDTQPSKFEDNSLEACLLDGNCLSCVPVLPNLLNAPIFSSQLKLCNEGRQASDNVKTNSN